MNKKTLTEAIIQRTLRVPKKYETLKIRESETISRQLDIALINTGFKADAKLLSHVASLSLADSNEYTSTILDSVKALIGDHVNHNVYFIDFPKNVPNAFEFWTELVSKAYTDCSEWNGNLLELNGYGKYQHTYEEMLDARRGLIFKPTAELKVLTLGDTLADETYRLYLSLSSSIVPPNEDDLALLKQLAEACSSNNQPEDIPVRENKAVINSVRATIGLDLLVDTVTDVLRLATYMSDGDVSLKTNTKFKNMPRKTRKALLEALDKIIKENNNKLGDVFKNRERFKRLDEILHSNDYKYLTNAQKVFKTARNATNLSFESSVERAFEQDNTKEAIRLLSNNPGMLVRNFNRLLLKTSLGELSDLTEALQNALPKVSTTVILGLRQYLNNRNNLSNRVFMNSKGTGKVIENKLPKISRKLLKPIEDILDTEIADRLKYEHYIIDPEVLDIALPLSNKQTNSGFNTMPRGSIDYVKANIVRLFTYWKESKTTTDYDLSAIFLDYNFNQVDQVSYTNTRAGSITYSGDITSAPEGASEFIDIKSKGIKENIKYGVLTVNNYSGEDFNSTEESFFGYMSRDDENGKPFEPATVKTKAEMRGDNKVIAPLVLIKEDDGWTVKWLNASLKGFSWGNATENNKITIATLTKAMIETEYLDIAYLAEIIGKKTQKTMVIEKLKNVDTGLFTENAKIVYITKEITEEMPKNVDVITLSNLHEMLSK